MALKVLAMGRLELREAILQELAENPVLEEIEDEPDVDDLWPWEALRHPGVDEDYPSVDQTFSRKPTLKEHLLWQVQMSHLNAVERKIAERLLGEMNSDGYLESIAFEEEKLALLTAAKALTTIDRLRALQDQQVAVAGHVSTVLAVAQEAQVTGSFVENVRQNVMRMDPLGCLSIDLKECLQVQLEARGCRSAGLESVLVRDFLPDVERHDYRKLMKVTGFGQKRLIAAIKTLESLEPKPGRAFAIDATGPQYVVPDVYLKRVAGELVATTSEHGLPKIRIGSAYIKHRFFKTNLRSASCLIRAIYQRQRTICRVTECIGNLQKDWFENKGPLRPLILKTVAEELGLHESTISRVTNGKYIMTEKGIFELKYFFSSAGETVKESIKKLIALESPQNPHSDDVLTQLLKAKNIHLARRTVAKYRETLGIFSASRRRHLSV